MPKSGLTNIAEKLLINKAIHGCKRFALEINCSHNHKSGRVDFATIDFDTNSQIPEITCYEIKVSESDFNSDNGHNLNGDYNYYVLSKELYTKIKDNGKYSHIFEDTWYNTIGVIVFTEKQLKMVLPSKLQQSYEKYTIDEKLKFIDQVLLSWTTGSMWKYLKRHEIELRNESDLAGRIL
jgi:hypothetical protein